VIEPRTTLVGEVPIVCVRPEAGAGRPRIALWLPDSSTRVPQVRRPDPSTTSHPGVGHIGRAQSAALLDRAIGWLWDHSAPANVPP
jgi:hypothetical protein